MTYPAIASGGTALRHAPRTDTEDDGFVTVHPQVNRHRGASPEDFDPRAIRQVLGEYAELSDDPTADAHAPLWREVSQKGDYWWTPDPARRRALALYGIIGTGPTDKGTAAAWLMAARVALAQIGDAA